MSRTISKSTYRRMPWKNGQGVTHEIARVPDQENYHWRLSRAEISADGDFSQFPGFDRWLVLIEGAGLVLGEEVLEPLRPIHFAGEDLKACRLRAGPVVDLGLIYDREKVRAEMSVVQDGRWPARSPSARYFFDLQTGDTLENPEIQFGRGVLISLFLKS